MPKRTVFEKESGGRDTKPLMEVALCTWLLFHYLPFPTCNVMVILFLLPKGSNFHHREHISYISFSNHEQLNDFPLLSAQECPEPILGRNARLSSALQAGSLWSKPRSATWDCTSHMTTETEVVFKCQGGATSQSTMRLPDLGENASQ